METPSPPDRPARPSSQGEAQTLPDLALGETLGGPALSEVMRSPASRAITGGRKPWRIPKSQSLSDMI